METFLIRALQLIMSLSLLVIIHEGGHFLFARLFKVRGENSVYSSILGLLCLSLNQRIAKQNMV